MSKILKRIGITLASTALAAGTVGGIVAASFAGERLIPLDDTYMPKDKIEFLADELGVDTSVMFKGDFFRLRHKNGDPINFYFEDNYPEECKSISIDAIDYLFGLVHDINPLYDYTVVEDSKSADITFKNKKIDQKTTSGNGEEIVEVEVGGYANVVTHTVVIDFEKLKNPETNTYNYHDVFFITLHETMHHFGYKDLYTNNAPHESKSIMTDGYENCTLSINEYDNLLLYYSPNTSKENLPQLVKTLKEKEKNYVQSLIDHFIIGPNAGLPNVILPSEENLVLDNEKYSVEINGDDYHLVIKDKKPIVSNNKIIKLDDNTLVLKNCRLPDDKFAYSIEETYILRTTNGYYLYIPKLCEKFLLDEVIMDTLNR